MCPANWRAVIETCFDRLGISADSYGGTAWTFKLPPTVYPVYAYLNEEWLCLDIPLDSTVTYHSAWTSLQGNATIRGAGKFALEVRPRRLHLQAEIPLIEEPTPDLLLQQTLTGFNDALSGTGPGTRKPLREGSDAVERLTGIFAEGGWSYSRKLANGLSLEIPVRQVPQLAHITLNENVCRLHTQLVRADVFDDAARFGLAILFLSASREIRWVRPYVDTQNSCETAGFEVCFMALPCAGELSHAFSALSTALQLCGAEALVMQDSSIAKQFLLHRAPIQKEDNV